MTNDTQSWDIFCRVVDNFGDIGTCWRLARQLAQEYEHKVRLWVNNLESFARLYPSILVDADRQYFESIEICRWQSEFPDVSVADVVIEAFACEIPPSYVQRMAQRATVPVWINLEYLTAEDWIEDCHLVESPHPTLPLKKFFFFPGFTPRTGGLLRERDLLTQRNVFDSSAKREFLKSIEATSSVDEMRISLFCYNNPALHDLLPCWVENAFPIRVFATTGYAVTQIESWLEEKLLSGTSVQKGSLTIQSIPFLSQLDYDRLLWSCDWNFVRGEDSFVRAQWAGRPFAWQIYPQAEMTHVVKLDAFLSKYVADFEHSELVCNFWRAWNGIGRVSDFWPEIAKKRQSLEEHAKVWSDQLDRTGNLANNLVLFVQNRR